jgi:ATP-dependent protease ClpP protease subunit
MDAKAAVEYGIVDEVLTLEELEEKNQNQEAGEAEE